MINDWQLVEELERRIEQFVGLGATDEQIRRLLDNWHIVSALAGGRLSAVFEEFIPVMPEKEHAAVEWGIWEEKLRHFPVRIDRSTPLRERLVRAGVAATSDSVRPLLAVPAEGDGFETLRLKIMRNRRAVTDEALFAMLDAKLLKPARLPHLLEFAAQHPDSVPPNLYAPGTRRFSESGTGDRVDIPGIRREMFGGKVGRTSRMALMTDSFDDRPGGVVYAPMQAFLVVRYPLSRDPDGNVVPA